MARTPTPRAAWAAAAAALLALLALHALQTTQALHGAEARPHAGAGHDAAAAARHHALTLRAATVKAAAEIYVNGTKVVETDDPVTDSFALALIQTGFGTICSPDPSGLVACTGTGAPAWRALDGTPYTFLTLDRIAPQLEIYLVTSDYDSVEDAAAAGAVTVLQLDRYRYDAFLIPQDGYGLFLPEISASMPVDTNMTIYGVALVLDDKLVIAQERLDPPVNVSAGSLVAVKYSIGYAFTLDPYSPDKVSLVDKFAMFWLLAAANYSDGEIKFLDLSTNTPVHVEFDTPIYAGITVSEPQPNGVVVVGVSTDDQLREPMKIARVGYSVRPLGEEARCHIVSITATLTSTETVHASRVVVAKAVPNSGVAGLYNSLTTVFSIPVNQTEAQALRVDLEVGVCVG